MKAEIKKEFRIGNIINYINSQGVKQDVIYCLNYTTLTIGDNFNRETIKYKSVLPIPLTEEWLKKFGFEKVIGWDDMEFWRKSDWQKTGFSLLKSLQGYEDDGYGRILPHIHVLQNFYYYSTGEELVCV